MFDVSRRETFQSIPKWLGELESYSNSKGIVKMLIGNKQDLPNRAVTYQEAERYAQGNDMVYCETSAKTNFSVSEAFTELGKLVINHK